MSTVHKLAGGLMLVTKGATDVLLDRCVVTPEERTRICLLYTSERGGRGC